MNENDALQVAWESLNTNERFIHCDPIAPANIAPGSPVGDFDFFRAYYINKDGLLSFLTIKPGISVRYESKETK